MAVSLNVEPFDVDFMPNWDRGNFDSAGGDLTVSFFGTEIWSLKVEDGYVDEYDQDQVKEVAKEELGKLIAERMNARITALEYGGVKIV